MQDINAGYSDILSKGRRNSAVVLDKRRTFREH